MNNIFGSKPVTNNDYFGRKSVVNHLKSILLSQNSFLLLGLRRTGKSSTLLEVARQIKGADNTIVIELNCQNYKSITDFYTNLHNALPTEWSEKLGEFLRNSKYIPSKIINVITHNVEKIDIGDLGSVELRNDTLQYSDVIKDEVTRFFKNRTEFIVLIVDELPFLFEHITKSENTASQQEVEAILGTLRSWREAGVAQAICGSLNLHTQLEQIGVSKKFLGGITTQDLKKYSVEDARGLLNALSESTNIELSDVQIDIILAKIPDRIPQFLQYYFFAVRTHGDGSDTTISSLYDEYVYPTIVKDFEYQFEERFAHMDEESAQTARKIFNLLKAKEGIPETEVLEAINSSETYKTLLLLTNQEFLVLNSKQEYSFSFHIVANWWSKKSRK